MQHPSLSYSGFTIAEKSRQIQNLYSPDISPDEHSMSLEESDMSCRICLDSATRDQVIAPCACSGSCKWVHRACLDKWRTTREDKAFSRCTECLKSYTLVSTTEDTDGERCCRKTKFILYVTRDVGIVFVISQLAVIWLSWLIWQCDGATNKGYLVKDI